MKIYGNRNTLWIEISKEEIGENIKLECKGEMLDCGFWIYKTEDISPFFLVVAVPINPAASIYPYKIL